MIFFAKAGGLFEDAHNICLTTWDIRGGYVLPVELIMDPNPKNIHLKQIQGFGG